MTRKGWPGIGEVDAVSRLLGGISDPRLRWLVEPLVRLHFERRLSRGSEAAAKGSRRQVLLTQSFGNAALAQDGVLVQWVTKNQFRSVSHIVKSARSLEWRRRYDLLRGLASAGSASRQTYLKHEVLAREAHHGPDFRPTVDLLARARLMLDSQRRLLTGTSPRVVVLATQHSLQSRGAILACEELRIPTVYIPHAPVATNRYYRDLPFDFAAVRGQREVEYYRSIGVDSPRIIAAGSPAVADQMVTESPSSSLPVTIIAPSPMNRATEEHFWSVIAGAGIRDALVSLHPAMAGARTGQTVPLGTIAEVQRTSDLLREFNSAKGILLAGDSGVLLDGLAHGFRSIRISPSEKRPNYAFIESPWVPTVQSAEDLKEILSARECLQAPELQAYAHGWTGPTGSVAESNITGLLDRVDTYIGMIHDEWAV